MINYVIIHFSVKMSQLAQLACIDSMKAFSRVTSVVEVFESVLVELDVVALSYRSESCVFKSQPHQSIMVGSMSKTLKLQLSCILHHPNEKLYGIMCYFILCNYYST